MADSNDGNDDDEEDFVNAPARRKRPDVAQRLHMQKTHRMTTVKCELNGKLAAPTRALMLTLINTLVEFSTKSFRTGSLAFNALLLYQLTTSPNGRLPTWFDVDSTDWLKNIVRRCMTGPGETSALEARFAEVPNMVHVNRMYPPHMVGTAQSLTYLAKTYVTVFQNHVRVHFEDRIQTFCSRCCREFPGVWGIAYRFVTGNICLLYTSPSPRD